jgi:hypothetical protein
VNWKKHSKYRHLKVVFHDKVYNLAKKKGHKFKHLTKSAHLFANQVDLKSHVGLRKSGTHLTLWEKQMIRLDFDWIHLLICLSVLMLTMLST